MSIKKIHITDTLVDSTLKKKTPKKEFFLLDRTLFGTYSKIKRWDVEIDWLGPLEQHLNFSSKDVKR